MTTRRWWKRRDGSDDADDLVPMDTQEQEELVRSLEEKQAHQSRRWRHVFAGFLLSYAVFLVYSSFHHAWSPWELRYHAYFMEDLPSPMVIVADDRVGVASMLDNFHVERSSSVSSVKKTNLGCHFVVTFCLRFVFFAQDEMLNLFASKFADWIAALACLFAVKGLLQASNSSKKWMWYSFYVGMAVAVFWTYYLLKLPRIRWDVVWLPLGPLIASALSLYVDHTLMKSMQDISTLRGYMYNFKSL